MIKRLAFLILILFLKLIQCIKVDNFCYQISINNEIIKCQENVRYNYDCGQGLCSIDRYSCQSIKLFSTVKDLQRNEKSYNFFQNNFEAFVKIIKDCPDPPEYKWSSNDVCMKTENCFKAYGYGIWSILMKPDECKCMGKYKYKCNINLCALNKKACDHLKHKKDFVVKKC